GGEPRDHREEGQTAGRGRLPLDAGHRRRSRSGAVGAAPGLRRARPADRSPDRRLSRPGGAARGGSPGWRAVHGPAVAAQAAVPAARPRGIGTRRAAPGLSPGPRRGGDLKPRIVFMGTPDFAVPALRAVAAAGDVVRVVTQPDRPRGRGLVAGGTPVAVAAEALGLPVMRVADMKSPAVR